MKHLLMITLMTIFSANAQAVVFAEGKARPQETAKLNIINASGFYMNVSAAQLTRITYEQTRNQGFVLDVRYRGQAQTQIEFIVKNIQRGQCNEVIYVGEMHIPYLHFTSGKPVIVVRDHRTNRCPHTLPLPVWQVSVQNGTMANDFINLTGEPAPVFTTMAVGGR